MTNISITLEKLLQLDCETLMHVLTIIDFSQLDEYQLYEIYNKLESDLSFEEWVAINQN